MDRPPSGLSPAQIDIAVEMIGAGGGLRVLPVAGDSMRPTLAPGDALLVDLAARSPRAGDLVLFRSGDALVVHRFLRRVRSRRRGPHLRMRGDARPTFDPPVRDEDLRGTVRAVRRAGTWWDLSGRRARLWAIAVALHDRFWGIAFSAAALRIGRDRAVARAVARLDGRLLRFADRTAFARMHARLPEPPPGEEADTAPLL